MRFFIRMLHVFIFIRTSWSPGVAASSTPDGVGPCDNYPCGPPEGADCIPRGVDYECICKQGYQQLPDKSCVPLGPCGTYPCGPNSDRCLWVGEGEYRCKCKKGFTENTLNQPTCVQAEGDCGYHPCGLGGLCKATSDGTHVCDCLSGYEQAPSTKGITCRSKQKVGCDQNPCGDESIARCVETQMSHFCVCREGATPQYDENGSAFCLQEQDYDPCYPGACGDKGTVCVFDGERRTCSCEAGANPKSVNLWNDERCYSSTEESNSNEGGNTESGGTEPGGGKVPDKKFKTAVLTAGGVVAALVLIGAVAGGVAYRRRKSSNQTLLEHQGSVDFEGRESARADVSEADVLIKSTNEDWAH